MTWLNDLFLFLVVPGLAIVAAIISYRGDAYGYKIVCETNQLGEKRYQVWFEYYSIGAQSRSWRLEETFDTLELADQYISRQTKTTETVREGSLK